MAEKASKQELDHPALHHLLVTPDIVHDLMEGLSEDQAMEKGKGDKLSLAEFLEYLSHIEAHYFRAAFDVMMSGGPRDRGRKIEPYNKEELLLSGNYSDREPEESLAHWEQRRDNNLEVLEKLSEADLARQAVHPEFGDMTLDQLLRAWAAHDLSAVQEIAGYTSRFLYRQEAWKEP